MKKITTSGKSYGNAKSLTRQQLKNVMGGVEPTTSVAHGCKTTDCKYLNVNFILTSSKCAYTSTVPLTGCTCGPVLDASCKEEVIVP